MIRLLIRWGNWKKIGVGIGMSLVLKIHMAVKSGRHLCATLDHNHANLKGPKGL